MDAWNIIFEFTVDEILLQSHSIALGYRIVSSTGI